eukprot:scaffold32150_cov64-Attheya_sp.AAC.5
MTTFPPFIPPFHSFRFSQIRSRIRYSFRSLSCFQLEAKLSFCPPIITLVSCCSSSVGYDVTNANQSINQSRALRTQYLSASQSKDDRRKNARQHDVYSLLTSIKEGKPQIKVKVNSSITYNPPSRLSHNPFSL